MRIKNVLLVLLGMLIFMLPSFYNGFPLVFSDTGMYILSGMELHVPADRPIVYGLLIRTFSFVGLWGVVAFQSLCLAFILYRVVRNVLSTNADRLYPVLCVFLSGTGAAAWYSSQLMPDIFSAILILSVFLVIVNNRLGIKDAPVLALLWLSALTHYSHIVLLIVLTAVLLVWHLIRKRKVYPVPNLIILTLITAIASLSLAFLNYRLDDRFGWSKGGHVFLVGRLIDTGIAAQYLDKHCEENTQIDWCAYRNNLPADSRTFLWGPESPLAEMGGWEGSERANKQLIGGVLSDATCWAALVGYGITGTLSQLTQNDVGSGLQTDWYSKPGSPPYDHIARHFPEQMNPYLQSKQNGNLWEQELNFSALNIANYAILLLSLIGLLLVRLSFWWKTLKTELRSLVGIVVTGIVLNAAVTGGLANVYDRLQSRVSWLLVFVAVCVLIEVLRKTRLFEPSRD